MKMPKINGSWHKDEQKGNFKNLLHKCLCRQTWNGSHREILIGKERECVSHLLKPSIFIFVVLVSVKWLRSSILVFVQNQSPLSDNYVK